jgi:predicted restriction endonuclease
VSRSKKAVRAAFRAAVFERDGHRCRVCGDPSEPLDAHHITSREEMPAGGYVLENGISLCPRDHERAEAGEFEPERLYELIGSSWEMAFEASQQLAEGQERR